jgi:membrane protein DedA with SNARE-associated domain
MLETLNHAFGLTYLILWAAVCARQLCLPVPANLFLLTAGALVHRGEVNIGLVTSMGVLGCLAGDLVCLRLADAGADRLCAYFARSAPTHIIVHSRHTGFSRDGVYIL